MIKNEQIFKAGAIFLTLLLVGCQTLGFGKDEPKEPAAEPTLEDTLTPVDPETQTAAKPTL